MEGRADILGVGFDRVGLAAASDLLALRLRSGVRTVVITANPEFVMLARREPDVAALARAADLVVADGTGILVASRVLGDPLPGRAPGRLLVDRLLARPDLAGRPVFLLGGAPGSAEDAASVLRRRGVHVAGSFGGDADPRGDAETVARIASSGAEILLVGFGMPRQERWLARNLGRLPGVKLAIGVGGVLDQLSGRATVPPRIVHTLGFEWLWRLVREPRRLKRQRVLPVFAFLVCRARVARGGR